MIADILSDAVAEIQEYLEDTPDLYEGTPLRGRLELLVARMDEMRRELDSLSPASLQRSNQP